MMIWRNEHEIKIHNLKIEGSLWIIRLWGQRYRFMINRLSISVNDLSKYLPWHHTIMFSCFFVTRFDWYPISGPNEISTITQLFCLNGYLKWDICNINECKHILWCVSLLLFVLCQAANLKAHNMHKLLCISACNFWAGMFNEFIIEIECWKH